MTNIWDTIQHYVGKLHNNIQGIQPLIYQAHSRIKKASIKSWDEKLSGPHSTFHKTTIQTHFLQKENWPRLSPILYTLTKFLSLMRLKLLYAVEKIWSDKSHSFVGTKKMKAQQLEHTQDWKVEIKEVFWTARCTRGKQGTH